MADPNCKNCGAPRVGGPCEYCTTQTDKEPTIVKQVPMGIFCGPVTADELDRIKYSDNPASALEWLRSEGVT